VICILDYVKIKHRPTAEEIENLFPNQIAKENVNMILYIPSDRFYNVHSMPLSLVFISEP
jgi:hypothetical protein